MWRNERTVTMHPGTERKLHWIEQAAAEPVGKVGSTCSPEWNSQEAMTHSTEVHSLSLLFTPSTYSARKCYSLNAASSSTSAMKYNKNYGVKKSASFPIWYERYNNQLLSLNKYSLFFFLFQKYFHAVFFPTQPKATVILALRRHYNQWYQET